MKQEGPRIIGVDLNDPFAALEQLKALPDEEIAHILVSLAKTSNNIQTLGLGLMHEMDKRMEKVEASGKDVQAGAELKDVSVEDLARMHVTSEGN